MSNQALLPANVGDLRRSCDFVRLRIFPLRMACPREGHPFDNRTVQLAGIERSSVPWRVSASGRRRARVSISVVVYGRGISSEGRIHSFVVDTFSAGL